MDPAFYTSIDLQPTHIISGWNHRNKNSETPEVQLNEVVQVLIEAGTFEEFKPNNWAVFFKIFSKKFEAVTDRIERLQDH